MEVLLGMLTEWLGHLQLRNYHRGRAAGLYSVLSEASTWQERRLPKQKKDHLSPRGLSSEQLQFCIVSIWKQATLW